MKRVGVALAAGVLAWGGAFAPAAARAQDWGATEPELVKDVTPTAGSTSYAPSFVRAGGALFFSPQYHPTHAGELWRTDGTPGGTVVVKDIRPGTASAAVAVLADLGGTLLLSADDGEHGAELWRSDGTADGTWMVKDVRPGAGATQPQVMFVHGSVAYLVLDDGLHGREIWRTDGTSDGTTLVKDINPGHSEVYGPLTSAPSFLGAIGGTMYFRARPGYDPGSSQTMVDELWKSDGTEAGTVRVAPLQYVSGPGLEFGGHLYFRVQVPPNYAVELWRTDGTESGTRPLLDPAPTGFRFSSLVDVFAGHLYFTASDATHGSELWRTDGTPEGTGLFADLSPGYATNGITPLSTGVSRFARVGDVLYLLCTTPAQGTELWRTDGTPEGTRIVRDIVPGNPTNPTTGYGSYLGPQSPCVVGSTLFFVEDDGVHGSELWRSDGTESGTVMVRDVRPGTIWSWYYGALPLSSSPAGLTALGDRLVFSADDGEVGAEIWRSDGTESGTVLVKDLNPTVNSSSSISRGVRTSNHVLFPCGNYYSGAGVELWRTDGTEQGTALVKDLSPGLDSTSFRDFLAVGDTAYFLAHTRADGWGIWKSDGTEAGTVRLAAGFATASLSPPSESLVAFGGRVLFIGRDAEHGWELWSTDGTPEGTRMLKDIFPGPSNGMSVGRMTPFRGHVYFQANDGVHGTELWRTDGTAAGTELFFDLRVYVTTQISAHFLTVCGEKMFFRGDDGIHGSELWVTDGTPAGTHMVKDVRPGGGYGLPQGVKAVNGKVVFWGDDGTTGWEPWVSDGTEEGTHLLAELYPGPNGSVVNTEPTAIVGDFLLFPATDGSNRQGLWRTDGTTAGTTLVAADMQYLGLFHPLADIFVFRGGASSAGEFWMTDGSPSGTKSIVGGFRFLGEPLGVFGETIVFYADDGVRGTELWRVRLRRSVDTDGDGLWDHWETEGYTHTDGTFVDLPALGADPRRKDVFVEIDSMAGTDHTHRPMASAIQKVVDAFAAAPVTNPDGTTGIRLHVFVDEDLPHQDVLGTWSGSSYAWAEFDAIREAHFEAARAPVFHYCVFAHDLRSTNSPSGVARGVPASHFIVALGSFTGSVGSEAQQAGTFMHELGHDLGLHHGGGDATNWKPNYLSVMNYAFQHEGLVRNGTVGWFDYSRCALDDLQESQLDETLGLGPTAGVAGYGTVYFTGADKRVVTDADGPINWDWSFEAVTSKGKTQFVPTYTGSAFADLSRDGNYGLLRGYDDWENLRFDGGEIGTGAGNPPPPLPPVTEAQELDVEEAKKIAKPGPASVRGHVADAQLVLTWTPLGPQADWTYRVYRSADGGPKVLVGTMDQTAFQDATVVSGSTYSYEITATGLDGVETWPSEAVVLTAR